MIFQSLRIELAHPRSSVQLCLLGIVGGISAATLIILFRLLIETLQISIWGDVAAYASSDSIKRLVVPFIAIIFILLIAKLTKFSQFRMGIPYVIHRFKRHYGHIPVVSNINQFFGGIITLASGFVVGKEGPSVHIAAAGSHFIGRKLKLPYNSLRVLTGCGIAAGIAAAFNTPFAAVIFVMEVVLREYKVYLFVPVMLAAACGAAMTQAVFGAQTELGFLSFELLSASQLIYLVVFGFCMGLLGAAFNTQLIFILKASSKLTIYTRFLIASFCTAVVAYFVPDAMGAEFINIKTLFESQPSLLYLSLLFVAKFMLATIALGLGIPGGIIGAVMTIGMLAGTLLLYPLIATGPSELTSNDLTSTFALLGLAGMLASVLHAPMAALSAAVELAGRPEAVMPSIIVIVSAYVTARQLCKGQSIFIQQLSFQQLKYTTSSVRDVLQKTGVLALMKTEFEIFEDSQNHKVRPHLQAHPDIPVLLAQTKDDSTSFDLVELKTDLQQAEDMPTSFRLQGLSQQATMAEVYELLYTVRRGAVYIFDEDPTKVVGIVTWSMLHAYLLREQH